MQTVCKQKKAPLQEGGYILSSPIVNFSLKPQTPLAVKMISQIIKHTVEIKFAEKNALKCL